MVESCILSDYHTSFFKKQLHENKMLSMQIFKASVFIQIP